MACFSGEAWCAIRSAASAVSLSLRRRTGVFSRIGKRVPYAFASASNCPASTFHSLVPFMAPCCRTYASMSLACRSTVCTSALAA